MEKFTEAKAAGAVGILIALMMSTAIVSEFFSQIPLWAAGFFGWTAGVFLISRVSYILLMQAGFLCLVGAMTLGLSVTLGGTPQWSRLLDANIGILTMLTAVSFLRLTTLDTPAGKREDRKGPEAFRETLFSIVLFGGFINISAPILIADRISQGKQLNLFTARTITRVFTGGAAWSPFFAGMAVVLTYVSEARLLPVMMTGIPFAATGLLVVMLEARIRYPGQLAAFAGYPMTPVNLRIPFTLTILVILGRFCFPHFSILNIIALAAITTTILLAISREGLFPAAGKLKIHILKSLPAMAGELLLFLAAGVITVGLSALINASHFSLPITGHFTPAMASLLLAAIILLGALGIHPVISISVTAPLLAPLQPDPLLLAVSYIFGWSLGTCASPLSGINLIIQSRYGISSVKVAVGNWPFVGVMLLISVLFLHLVGAISGT